jgi:putative oxidoreductase
MAGGKWENPMKRFLYNRYLSIAIRMFLGVTFLYASWSKIFDAQAFAQMIWNYKLIPLAMIHPLALFVPWMEVVIGLALISGVFRKGGALLAGGLLLIFMLAISINLARDNSINCGCFSTVDVPLNHEQGIWLMKVDLLRDLGLLLLALHSLATPITWKCATNYNR